MQLEDRDCAKRRASAPCPEEHAKTGLHPTRQLQSGAAHRRAGMYQTAGSCLAAHGPGRAGCRHPWPHASIPSPPRSTLRAPQAPDTDHLTLNTWSALGRSLLCGTAAVLAGLAAGSASTCGQRARMLLSRRVSGFGVRTVAAAAVAAAGRLRGSARRAGVIHVQALAAEQPQDAAGRGMRAVSWRRGLRLLSRIRVRANQSSLRILAQCRRPAAVGGVSRSRSSMVGMQVTHRVCESAAHTGRATTPGRH